LVRVCFIKLWLIARAMAYLLVAPLQGLGDESELKHEA
jgi:hypothetical protein